ncbi:MAG: S1 family peptidase [Ktedonobacteraceae bacterium]
MLIRHDHSDRESLVDPCKWPAITSFFRGHGAASLIAPTWLLTAAHVARHIPTEHHLSVELQEKRYPIARVIIHPDYKDVWEQGDEDDGINTVDLALVELEMSVENVRPLALYTHSDEQGQEVILLGAGECGNGLRGTRGSDRQLRRVTNIIDEVDAYWLAFRFDEPPNGTALEGVCGRGDSGGPALIEHDSQLLLAGISSWQDAKGQPLGLYGCIEHFARVSCYVDWIRDVCKNSL